MTPSKRRRMGREAWFQGASDEDRRDANPWIEQADGFKPQRNALEVAIDGPPIMVKHIGWAEDFDVGWEQEEFAYQRRLREEAEAAERRNDGEPEPVAMADGGDVVWIDGMQFDDNEVLLYCEKPGGLDKLKELIAVQLSDGNWNYDDYMRGMANGMLMAQSVFDGVTPKFLDPPANGYIKGIGPWQAAVLDQLGVICAYKTEHDNDPVLAIQDLINWHCQVSLDPNVSQGALDLIRASKANGPDLGIIQDGVQNLLRNMKKMMVAADSQNSVDLILHAESLVQIIDKELLRSVCPKCKKIRQYSVPDQTDCDQCVKEEVDEEFDWGPVL